MADTIKDQAARVAGWFGPRLRELRAKAGLSQKALAERMCVAQSRIAEYESDKTRYAPNWDTVIRAALAFDVSVETFTRPPAEEPTSENIRNPD